MFKTRLVAPLVALLAAGVVLAGCGADDPGSEAASANTERADSSDVQPADEVESELVDEAEPMSTDQLVEAACQATGTDVVGGPYRNSEGETEFITWACGGDHPGTSNGYPNVHAFASDTDAQTYLGRRECSSQAKYYVLPGVGIIGWDHRRAANVNASHEKLLELGAVDLCP